MFKKIIIILVLLALLLVGAVFWVLNNPQATVAMINFMWAQPDSEVSFKTIKISDQKFRFPGELMIKQIELDFVSYEVLYEIDIGEFRVENLYKLFSENMLGAIIDVDGMNIKSELSKIEDMSIMLKQEQGYKFNGSIKVFKIEAQGIIAKDTRSKVNINQEKIDFVDIEMESCNGFIQGNMEVYLNKPDFKINLQMEDLDAEMIEHIYPPVLSNVRGKLSGHIFMQGLTYGIGSIKCDFKMNEGSELNAVLLVPLIAYIPDQAKTDKLIKAIQSQDMFSVDKAQIRVYNENDQAISSDILLKSEEMNLDVEVTVDFNIEGGIKNLLKYSLNKS